MVPLVITPSPVYIGELGFFLTPIIGRQNVAFSSGCVTCAFLNLNACNVVKLSVGFYFVLANMIPEYISTCLEGKWDAIPLYLMLVCGWVCQSSIIIA